jgi:hypothetical protein
MNTCTFNQVKKEIGSEHKLKNMMNLCQLKNRNYKHLKDWDKNMHLVHFYKKNSILQKDLVLKELIQ